jgi:hypothetical protein
MKDHRAAAASKHAAPHMPPAKRAAGPTHGAEDEVGDALGGVGLHAPADFFGQISAGYLAAARQRIVDACLRVGWPTGAIEAGELDEWLCDLAEEADPDRSSAVGGDFRNVPLSGFGFVLVGDDTLDALWPHDLPLPPQVRELHEDLAAGTPRIAVARTQSDIFAWMEFHSMTEPTRIDPADADKVLDWFTWAASSSDGDSSSWWVHTDPGQARCSEPGADDQPWWRALHAAAHADVFGVAHALDESRARYSPTGHLLLTDAANHILVLAQAASEFRHWTDQPHPGATRHFVECPVCGRTTHYPDAEQAHDWSTAHRHQ